MASSQGALRATETPESTDLTPSAGSPSQELPYSEVSDSDPTTSDYGVNEETGDLYRYPSPTLLQTAPIGVREDPPASPRRKRPAKMAAGSGGRVPKRARHQSDNEEGASASPSPSPSLPAYQPTDGRLYKTTEAHRKASIKSHRAAKERKLEEHRELRAQIPLAFQSQEVIQEGGAAERRRAIDEGNAYVAWMERRVAELERQQAAARGGAGAGTEGEEGGEEDGEEGDMAEEAE